MSIISLVRLSNDTAEFLIAELQDIIDNSRDLGKKESGEIFQLMQALTQFDSIRLDIETPPVEDLAA